MRLNPTTAEELAAALADAANSHRSIELGGAFTKRDMAGPIAAADVVISTSALTGVIQYEPRDLTVSVRAGTPFAELQRVLAANGQTIPLDPAFASECTTGGIVSANISGPRRRLYGTARDLVIGMTFATLEGKVVPTGGMVVKNVAGLDMGKLLIGSFGTLAAVTSVNFRVHPLPRATRTFVQRFEKLEDAFGARDQLLASVLQPTSVDLLREDGGASLLVQASGSAAVLARYRAGLPVAEALAADAETALWTRIREFTPTYRAQHSDAVVIRISSTLTGLPSVFTSLEPPVIARAANGVAYAYFPTVDAAQSWIGRTQFRYAIEWAPQHAKENLTLWPDPGSGFAIMEKIKHLFDPQRLLNRGRLYGRF